MATRRATHDLPKKQSTGYTPRWIPFISQILDGLFDGDRSGRNDQTTRRIMLTCLRTLAKGNALSEKQCAAFIDNIRIRLGRSDFQWQGPIKLTRSQVPAARQLLALHAGAANCRGIDAEIEQDLMGEVAVLKARVVDLERALSEILHACDGGFAPMPLNSCALPAETTLEAAKSAGLPTLTKRNETKRDHGTRMICPSGATDPKSIAMPSAPANDVLPSTSDKENEPHHSSARRRGGARAVVSYFRNDPLRPPSANLEIGGERYSLVFHAADMAEEKMKGSFSSEWMRQFEDAFGKAIRAQSRANNASDHRYVMSPLYGGTDSFGLKQPAVPDCVAVLMWSGDAVPQSVVVLIGDGDVTIPLAPVAQTKPKGPTHKGSVMLAA